MKNKKIISYLHTKAQEKKLNPITKEELANVESKLKVTLPEDFKEITKSYSYEFFPTFEFYNFGRENNHSVIGETLELRKNMGLPHRYIVLSEDDVSFLTLETQDSPIKNAPVIWCDIEDVYQICDEKPLLYKHRVFHTFTDFFEYLLDQEEEERKEN